MRNEVIDLTDDAPPCVVDLTGTDQMSDLINQMSYLTLSDLPTDLHRLILSHDEEKKCLKKKNEQLNTRVKMLQCLLDEARQDSDSDSDSDISSDISTDEEFEDGKDIFKRYLNMSFTVPQLRHQLKNAGIKGYSKANKAELVERLAIHRTS